MGQWGTVWAGEYGVSMEEETKIINWEQDFLYITEQYLLAIGGRV